MAVPIIVTLYQDKIDFIQNVPIVPIFQFSSFIDDFYGNLDQMNSDQVHRLLLELNHELSMTLMVVTHNMELASYMSRRVTIVGGRLKDIN